MTGIDLNGLRIDNPLIVASGTFGHGDKHPELAAHAGAFVSKTVTLEPRRGNPPSRIVETPSGIVNYVGLQNPGIAAFATKLEGMSFPTTFIVSVNAVELESMVAMLDRLEGVSGIAGYELNLSCPNIKTRSVLPFVDIEVVAGLIRAARERTERWLCAKLPPYAGIQAGPVCEEAGANALCVSNTYPSVAYSPRGERIQGGLSGPAIKPMVLYNVHHTAKRVSIPVISSGGVCCGRDVEEMLQEGAKAVQIGSIQFIYPDAVERILGEWRGLKAGVKELG